MCIGRIKQIIKRICPSWSYVVIFIVISLFLSVYILLEPNNNKNTNFNKKNNESNMWNYNKNDVKTDDEVKREEPSIFIYRDLLLYFLYFLSYFVPLIMLVAACYCFCKYNFSWDCILFYLYKYYNRLFRRNQARDDERVVYYRGNRIYWRGREDVLRSSEYYSSNEEFNSESYD